MKIRSFRDLDAWKAAMDLACSAYKIAAQLPALERFELASQVRRSAVSVPSNVAEGHACGLRNRYRNHVRLAAGSLGELATQVELARRLNYIDGDTVTEVEAQLTRTAQLLHGILRSLRFQAAVAGTAGALALITAFIAM
jgi:four helix bundle protein